MIMFTQLASISSENLFKVTIFLGIAAIFCAGPLIWRILSGREKFGWFTNPEFARLNKKDWQKLCNKADQILECRLEVSDRELYELFNTMLNEIIMFEHNKTSVDYENDCERVRELAQKLKMRKICTEPFDSLIRHLKNDGLNEQADKLYIMVESSSDISMSEWKVEMISELTKIKSEYGEILSHETKKALKKTFKFLKHNPWKSVFIYSGIFLFALGLRLYYSIFEENGYEFYKRNPVWILVFTLIIGIPLLILFVKFLIWTRSIRENPYDQFVS